MRMLTVQQLMEMIQNSHKQELSENQVHYWFKVFGKEKEESCEPSSEMTEN